ncbi:MAG: DUF4386 domain-containing protein [Vicinamibacteraceae bacterium]
MTRRAVEGSPQTYARIGGGLYLFIIVAALFGQIFVRDSLIVSGDAAATANNILASETLFRVGLAGELLTCVCDVALALILYVLLEPVSRTVALLAAFYRLTFVAVYAVAKLFLLMAAGVLGGTVYLNAFEQKPLEALAYLSLRLHGDGYGVALIFFGVMCILLGVLIYKSGYLPSLIGLLLAIGGAGYLVSSFAVILAPAFGASLFPWALLPAFFAELGLALWLVVKGVDVPTWEARTLG